ncbi:MAG TPA: Rv0909 family putative TA system antitoxin [Candidatus Nanopelagicales bacterium]
MGIGDMINQAKDALGNNSEAVDGAIDQAADVAKDKTPDQVDGAVDQAAQAAKDAL